MNLRILRLDTLVEGHTETQLMAVDETYLFGPGIPSVEDLKPIGYVALQRGNVLCGSFRMLFVDPQSRRAGIGSALVKECCRIALDEDKNESIGITVAADSPHLYDFYRGLGFHFSAEYSDGSFAMCKVLPDNDDSVVLNAVVLDESSILKSLDGKTRRKLTAMFRSTQFRLSRYRDTGPE